MKLFGNNYEEEIKRIKEVNKLLQNNIGLLNERLNNQSDYINSIQESMIELARSVATQKSSITFLLNNACVDSDSQGDFLKLLKEVKEINNIGKTKTNTKVRKR